MPPLYVSTQNAKLRIHQRRLLVELDGKELLSTPLGHVSEVLIFGNVGLTTPAIGLLLAEGIDVVFLFEDGGYRGRLSVGMTPHVPVRRAQYRALDREDFVLETAKSIVIAKLSHQRALLQRHNRERGEARIQQAVDQLEQAIQEAPRKIAISSLMGVEGSATAAYFSGLRPLFGAEWKFEKRTRRPPADPVNVLLSLGYTLLAQACFGAAQAAGLDPYAGFLHEVVYNRPALGLDLMEEFRPVVDGVALWACNSGQLTPQHFSPGPPERPVILSEEGKRIFLRAYEQRMDGRFTHPLRQQQLTLRQCLVEQARQLAERALQNNPGFTGMGFR